MRVRSWVAAGAVVIGLAAPVLAVTYCLRSDNVQGNEPRPHYGGGLDCRWHPGSTH